MVKNEKIKDTAREERVAIVEKGFANICGWHVGLDSIWIHDGVMKADLIMWSDRHRKPFSGGYQKGSSVEIGTTECVYYVSEIKKFGKNNEKPGYAILSVTKPESVTTKGYSEMEEVEETTAAKIGDVKFGLGNILREKDGKMVAGIYPPVNSPLGNDFDVCEGDTLWVGECAYNVEKIVEGHSTKNGRYENGYIILKKLKQKITGEGPIIPGELMSRPPFNLKDVPELFGNKRGEK
nr:hypothetical protein [Candidatus Freyarchaeota archaeon]